MKIVADENIPLLQPMFDKIGDIVTLKGRDIAPEDVVDADILLVRSVTKVDESLLQGSKVKFVGTATIGLDHIDTKYLQDNGIAFANAPGCNANSVVEYVLSCLSFLSEYFQFAISDKSIGVIGCGNVGGRLAKTLERLGMTVKRHDPPLAETSDGEAFVDLDEALSCDIISFHVPLVKSGDYPTYHLLNRERLEKLNPHQIIINTSRGEVIDNDALLDKLKVTPDMPVVLDVWEKEPEISLDLLKQVAIGTPHIAGYSADGKANGTEMIYQSLCKHLGLPVRQKAAQFMQEPALTKMAFSGQAESDWLVNRAIRACYDVRSDHWRLRSVMSKSDNVAADFDTLRKEYPYRREFAHTKVVLKNVEPEIHSRLKNLGFKIKA